MHKTDDLICTALHHAAENGQVNAVRCLIERGVVGDDGGRIEDHAGQTALHKAAACSGGGRLHYTMLQDLLRVGFNPSQPDNKGQTPLELAAARGNPTEVCILLPPVLVDLFGAC